MATVNVFLLSFSVTVFFFLQGTEAGDCPKLWKSYQDFCYGIIERDTTWADAEVDCQTRGLGGHLASIPSKSELAIIAGTIKHSYPHVKELWIGLEDPRGTGLWEWSDSNPFNFKNWSPWATKVKGNCGYISSATGFKEFEKGCCQRPRAYLCKSTM